jgi:hypothetical protein
MNNNDIKLEYDIPELYPPLSELMIALQDEGKESFDKKGAKLLTYKALHKFGKSLHTILVDRKISDMDTNTTRGTKRIINHLIMLRRMVDTSSVHEPLRKYCLQKDNKMFIIENNIYHAGYQLLLDQITEYLNSNIISSSAMRNSNDALRVCGILLHEHYRSSVAAIMKNKKDRVACDLPKDPIEAFCDEAVNDFNDHDFIIIEPSMAHEIDGYNDMDANDIDRIKIKRNGKWFWNTWKDYFRPKYRAALNKWSKDTGGGSGRASSFQKFYIGDK